MTGSEGRLSGTDTVRVVVALFGDGAAADTAADGLRSWSGAHPDLRLGAFGRLRMVRDELRGTVGNLVGRGSLVQDVLFVLAATDPSLVAPFHAASGDLRAADASDIRDQVASGREALVVVCDHYEHEATRTKLWILGGEVQAFRIPMDALNRVRGGSSPA